MTSQELLEEMQAEEILCNYCRYNNECPHDFVCYGGESIEPPCCTWDLIEIIDYESYCEENGIEIEE